ncbi:MAG: MoaD/ThiS family protein [Cyclobacteriaceae bacterium]|nr:MoaD/ThiS family protein [Cyclobacteriaceae bacterium]
MPKVSFTRALKRFYPDLDSMEVPASNVAELLDQLNRQHPGLKDYLVDEQGQLRQHVNIFIGDKLIRDKVNLLDEVDDQDEVFIMQALSGG